MRNCAFANPATVDHIARMSDDAFENTPSDARSLWRRILLVTGIL